MADNTVNTNLNFNTNASNAKVEVDALASSIAHTGNTSNTTAKSVDNLSGAFKKNGTAVLENGGAMGLLNDLTGGYAMMVKDAVEASALFIKAKKADAVATEVQAVATTKASVATTIWNAVLALNPVVAITAGVVALTGALYYLTKSFLDEKGVIEDLNKSIDSQKFKQERLNRTLEDARLAVQGYNTLEIARARALGASSKEIDAIILKQAELAQATGFTNAKIARQNQIAAENSLRNARIVGDEDTIKKAEEFLAAQTEAYKKANDEYNNTIINVGVTRYGIQQKQREDNQKAVDDANSKTKAKQDEVDKKEKEAKDKKLAEDKAYYEQLIKDKAKFEADIRNAGLESKAEEEEEKGLAQEKRLADISVEVDALEQANLNIIEGKKNVDKEILASEQEKNDAIGKSKEMLTNLVSNLEDSGLAKTKAGQVVAKGIALAQIGIDSAVALGNATKLANQEGVAAQAALPTVPGIGTAARILSYASTALSVAANIKRAKSLLSGGGSAGGGGESGGSSAPSSRPAASAMPNVSFVSSSENQLQQSINTKNAEQSPIKAYVVASDVTNQQVLDEKIKNKTTM